MRTIHFTVAMPCRDRMGSRLPDWCHYHSVRRAFTLIELLVVMGIITILITLTKPALTALTGANSVNKASADVALTLEQARTYAMANNTYVRVGIGATTSATVPQLVVLCLASKDGVLDITDMSKWSTICIPLILADFSVNDPLVFSHANTANDLTPSASNIGNYSRTVGNLGTVTFKSWIQFNSSGTAGVMQSVAGTSGTPTFLPARYISLGVDRIASNGNNPFVVRLTALTGNTQILRKENL